MYACMPALGAQRPVSREKNEPKEIEHSAAKTEAAMEGGARSARFAC